MLLVKRYCDKSFILQLFEVRHSILKSSYERLRAASVCHSLVCRSLLCYLLVWSHKSKYSLQTNPLRGENSMKSIVQKIMRLLHH